MQDTSGTSRAARGGAVAHALVLWIALAVALSPSFAELVQHWTREPWARGSAVFLPLGLAIAVADRTQARPRRAGWLLVGAGLSLALFGFAAGVAPLGRLAIPLTVLGMALAIGHPAPRVALVALFLVPPPFGIVGIWSPGAERAVAGLAVDAGRVLGADWALGNATVRAAGGDLRLGAQDLGIPLAHLLAGLGFCAGIASGAPVLRAALHGLLWALWAVPAQLLALIAALFVLTVAGAGAARAFLDVAPACAVVALAVPWLVARSPRRVFPRPRITAADRV